jgi:hypothetical protein
MWTWLALLGTPLLSLSNLAISHALATPSCAHQAERWLHGANALHVALCVLLLVMAWRDTGAWPAFHRDDAADPATRRRFVSSMALPCALLFTAVTLAQWLAVWVMSPCAA